MSDKLENNVIEDAKNFAKEYDKLRVFVSDILDKINIGENYKLIATEDEVIDHLNNMVNDHIGISNLIYYKYKKDFKNFDIKLDINNGDFRNEICNQLYEREYKNIVLNVVKWIYGPFDD